VTWFKVDDGIAFHRKTVAAGNAAMGLWLRAGAWSMAQLSDGFVPKRIANTIGTPAQIKRLVQVGFWIETDSGYQFHQFNDVGRQIPREQVEREREAERLRKASQRASQRDTSPDTGRTPRGTPPRLPETQSSPVQSSPNSKYPSQSTTDLIARANDQLTDEQIGTIARHLHTSRSWAQQTAEQILARAPGPIGNPGGYVIKAIKSNPDRYKPERRDMPPMFRSANTCKQHPWEDADNCRACAADRLAAS
jgi:hypothetical protein